MIGHWLPLTLEQKVDLLDCLYESRVHPEGGGGIGRSSRLFAVSQEDPNVVEVLVFESKRHPMRCTAIYTEDELEALALVLLHEPTQKPDWYAGFVDRLDPMKDDKKVLDFIRPRLRWQRSYELLVSFRQLRETHDSDDAAAACTLQKLTEEEGRLLWSFTPAGKPPEDWRDETNSKPCPICNTLLPVAHT